MKKKFSFGKVAYLNPNIKNNAVEVEWKPNSQGRMVFTASGEIWNNIHTDIYCGRQCLDELNEFSSVRNNPTFKEIYRLWKLYHLNDMHAGTVEQENSIKAHFGNKYADYSEKCEYLKSVGLYEVAHPYTGEPYCYGHGWLYREIPEEDIQKIEELFV